MSIPLAFVSPQTLLLESFRLALSGADFQVRLMPFQGQFADMELIESRPRIVVLDAACEGGTPMVWIDRLKVALPDTRVLVYLRQVRGTECQTLLSVGAKGLADQRISGSEVLAGIRRMLRGEVYLSPRVAQAIALCRLGQTNPFQSLSPRELTVCDLVVEGSRAPEIARNLSVSPKTVNTYRYRIFEKLGISSDVQLTHLAYQHGLKGLESPNGRF